MALNIKDAETDRLVRELAELTGESITVAVREAVMGRLQAVRRRSFSQADELGAIIDRGRSRSVLDTRPAEEILGYGPDGVPT